MGLQVLKNSKWDKGEAFFCTCFYSLNYPPPLVDIFMGWETILRGYVWSQHGMILATMSSNLMMGPK